MSACNTKSTTMFWIHFGRNMVKMSGYFIHSFS